MRDARGHRIDCFLIRFAFQFIAFKGFCSKIDRNDIRQNNGAEDEQDGIQLVQAAQSADLAGAGGDNTRDLAFEALQSEGSS
jgi:hypothetical protein